MKNIHLIEVDKPSRLFSYNGELGLAKGFQYGSDAIQNLHIYITSDERPKERDYCIYKDKTKNSEFILRYEDDIGLPKFLFKKIILTTDQDLIKDGVQTIDDEFLEGYVQNPNCEEVEIDCRLTIKENGIQELMKDEYYQKFPEELPNCVFINHYKIIIPKEESKPIHQQIIDIVGGEERFKEIAKIKPKKIFQCKN